MKEDKRKKLVNLLGKIGFSIRNHGADFWYIYTNEDKCTGYMLYGEHDVRIQHELEDYKGGMTWYLKDCVIKMLNEKEDTVSIYPKGKASVFILFNNFKK